MSKVFTLWNITFWLENRDRHHKREKRRKKKKKKVEIRGVEPRASRTLRPGLQVQRCEASALPLSYIPNDNLRVDKLNISTSDLLI